MQACTELSPGKAGRAAVMAGAVVGVGSVGNPNKEHTVRFPSPSMAVALAALAVATVGSATAVRHLLTGADVKDGSLTGKDIRAGSLALSDLSPSVLSDLRGKPGPVGPSGPSGPSGPTGPAGLAGLTGVQGARGGFDPSKISYVVSPIATVPIGHYNTAYALCPAGAKATGGGHSSHGRTITSWAMTGGVGWQAYAVNQTLNPVNLFAFAVCASP